MDKRKGLLCALLALIFTSLLCLGLYHFDNKYTREDTQPISGVLFFPEDADFCYLTRQWVLYPDALLSPQDLEAYEGYRRYADIGGQVLPGKGSATYRMRILLPGGPREYAMELPEVFSTCSLYINGQQALQLGTPNAAHYREGLRTTVITFTAHQQVDLLLAVTDRSGLGLGLNYPPAFGLSGAVQQARELRLLLHGGLCLLAVLGMLLSLSFGLRREPLRCILSALLCIAVAVVTGYPLYHGLMVTAAQPWYTLEPVCYYALLLLALLLQGRLYRLAHRPALLLAAPCMAGLLVTALRFGLAAFLPAGTAQVFSVLAALLKYYTAACLLGLSLWAVWRSKAHAPLLLCGSVALAACLLWDRLLPLYEPIYGGWLGEVGGLLLTLSLAAALWLEAVSAYQFRLEHEASFRQMEQRLALQKEHYQQLSHQIRLAREAGHDLRHHVRTMQGMAQQEQWHKLSAYLADYEPHLREREFTIWSDHPTADAVLGHYAATARRLGIPYDVRLAIPPDLPFPDDELCILLSNLLENAMEALGQQTQGARRLYLRGDASDGRLGLVVDNTFTGPRRVREGVFLSTKHGGHGLGLSSVTTIAEKYHGLADFSAENGVFHASVLIPLANVPTQHH